MTDTLPAVQTSRIALRFGKHVSFEAEVRMTPLGLLSVGGLVSAILLSVPPIIRASAQARRSLPNASGSPAAPDR